MSTRFYFRATAAPAVSPAFHSGWDVTAGAIRRQMATTKLAGDTVTLTAGNSGSITDDVLYVQLVSDPMAAGILIPNASALDCWSYGLESSGGDNLRCAAAVAVFSQDGTTLRRNVTSTLITGGGGEWPFSGFPARSRPFLNDNSSGADYTTVAGDRLVVLELGHSTTALGGSPNGAARIGSNSTGADAPEIETDESLTAVGWFEFTPNITFLADVASPGGQEGRLRIGLTDVIGWEIDGLPVELRDWQAEVSTGWGDKACTGTLGREVTWAQQGSEVIGWKRSGEPLWQGKLVTDPRRDGDRLTIRAEGSAADIDALSTRLFYRTDGGGSWTDAEGDPHNYGGISDLLDAEAGPGRLMFRTTPDKAYTLGEQNALALWVEGGLITRVAYTMRKNGNQSNMDIYTSRATGPSGSGTNVDTFALSAANPDGTANAFNISSPEDLITIALRVNTAFTPTVRQKFWLTGLKVYGRTTDDAYSASDVVTDVATLAGLGTDGVDANALAVLPIDWTDDPTALLDYMAELVDWRWMARGAEMTFGPYGKVWESATGHGASPSLEPEPRANLFKQPFRAMSGRLRTVTASPLVDPYPGQEIVVSGEELEDPQPNADLATAVAAAAVEFEASVRRSGPVELSEVRFQGGSWSPYDVDAGDQLLLTDLAPDLGPQRIESITYRPGGMATAHLGSAFNLVATLAEAERPPRRRRKKRRRRTGGPIR